MPEGDLSRLRDFNDPDSSLNRLEIGTSRLDRGAQFIALGVESIHARHCAGSERRNPHDTWCVGYIRPAPAIHPLQRGRHEARWLARHVWKPHAGAL